jgi:hypothetical protein
MRDAEPAMCEKCKELDQEVERYREQSQSATTSQRLIGSKNSLGTFSSKRLLCIASPQDRKSEAAGTGPFPSRQFWSFS